MLSKSLISVPTPHPLLRSRSSKLLPFRMSASASSSSKPLAPGAPLPPSLQMLYQKQQEYAALQALKEASEALVTRADRLAEMSTTMAEGGECE